MSRKDIGAGNPAAGTIKKSNKLRDNRILGEIFRDINKKGDGVLSVEEIMDLGTKLDYFFTESEADQIRKSMDVNNDDRVEEVLISSTKLF